MEWLLLALIPLMGILVAWGYGWLRRNRKPPKPTKPYKEWN